MIRSIGFTVFATLMGQVLSFLTDILIAKNFGTSWKADSYFFALVIPITLADLFIHGINATFIPTYMTYQKAGKGSSFFNSIVNVSIGIILCVAAMTFIYVPDLVNLIAGAFSPAARQLTISLTKLLLVLTISMPLYTILANRLNAHNQFALPALGKVFNFGSIILCLILLKESLDIYSLPVGYLIGSVLFVFSLIFLSRKKGLGYSAKIDLSHPGLKEVGILLIPFVGATMVNYINIFVERSVAASFSEGSIASLNYAFKVVNIPLHLFVMAAMIVVLPTLSNHAAENDMDKIRDLVYKALRFVFFFILPVIAGIVIFRIPLVRLLFERGAFTAQATELTARSLLCYAFGILGLAAVTVMSRVFYALKDIKTLSLISVCMVILNIVLILSLSKTIGFAGIPITFSIGSTVHMFVMAVLLGKRLDTSLIKQLFKDFFKHALSALVMALAIMSLASAADKSMILSSSTLYLFSATTLGIIVYLLFSYLLKVKEMELIFDIAGKVRKKVWGFSE